MSEKIDIKQIIELIFEYWGSRNALLVGNLIILCLFVWKFSENNLTLTEIISIILICLFFSIVWKITVRIPRTPFNHIGFAVAISCEEKEEHK